MGDSNEIQLILLVLQVALTVSRILPVMGRGRLTSTQLAERVTRLERQIEALRSRRSN
jgi:hypothetical protein